MNDDNYEPLRKDVHASIKEMDEMAASLAREVKTLPADMMLTGHELSAEAQAVGTMLTLGSARLGRIQKEKTAVNDAERIKLTIPFHPLAEIFPLIEGEEFAELVADIKAKGLLEPIVLYEGKILEGRNRARACEAAGIEPSTKNYEGTDPLGFIFSANIVRRHLTPGQRAMAVAQLATFSQGRPKRGEIMRNNRLSQLTVQEAANLGQVAMKTVHQAKLVSANGTPEEIADVNTGKVTLNKAFTAVRERNHMRSGSRAKVPDGYKSLTEAVMPGIEFERTTGASSIKAARKIGIATQTYTCVRDIVLLSQRNDLSERDHKAVQSALAEINETRRVKHPQQLVKHISLRVWGRNGNRYKSDKTRRIAFTDSIMFVVTGCAAIADQEIPALEKKHRTNTIKELSSAISALQKLRRRLKTENGQ